MREGESFVADRDHLLKYLRISVERASREGARVVMPLEEYHRNGWGAAHGGVISTLADAAFGAAANHGTQYAVVTLSSNVDFLRPAMRGPLSAESVAIHLGRQILNYEVKVYDGEGALVARGALTGFVTSKPLLS